MKVKSVTTSVLMVSILGMSALNIFHLIQTPKEVELDNPTQLETYFNENFIGKIQFVDFYGVIQKWMGKNEVDNFDVIRDEQGKLHFSYFSKGSNDMSEINQEMKNFKNYLDLYAVDVAFIMPPDKVIKGYTTFSKGLPYNYANEGADEFLRKLSEDKIDYLDLREDILQSGIEPSDLFFDTDHHWTPRTAFWGFTQVVSFLNERYGLVLDEGYTDLNQYEQISYPQSFLGSLGKRTGYGYAGMDDFIVIKPMFETNLTYTWDGNTVTATFDETVLQTHWLSEDLGIEADHYMVYLGGNYGEVRIKNNLYENGPKILMIKDSFMLPLAAFLSTTVGEMKLIDLRYYEGGSLYELVPMYQPDIVLVSVSPSNLVPEFFNFSKGE